MEKITIVIPSRNRPISLLRCIKSIKRQDNYIHEIIVSNDSEKKYNNVYTKISEKYNFILLQGPRNGLYANHNFLYNKCKTSHLRIVDDDHTFPENHFMHCINAINEDPHCVWSIGEKYPNDNEIFLPREVNARGFSSISKNYNDNIALASGSSIYPTFIFEEKKIFEIEDYKFGMVWMEFALRLEKNGIKIRTLTKTYVNHFYNQDNRSYNSERLDLETKFFIIFAHNLIYKKKLINILLGFYEIMKELVFFRPKKIIYLISSIRKFIKIKKTGIWNFK
jgi:glycosyltransferase involved in cell wall biosynthesis